MTGPMGCVIHVWKESIMDLETILILTPEGPRLYDVGDELRAPELVQEPDERDESESN